MFLKARDASLRVGIDGTLPKDIRIMIEALDGAVLLAIVLVVASDKWEAYLRLAEYKGNAIYLGKDDKKNLRERKKARSTRGKACDLCSSLLFA